MRAFVCCFFLMMSAMIHKDSSMMIMVSFRLLIAGKKLLSEWKADTAKRELVLSATFPMPQDPSNRMPKNNRLVPVKSTFKCQMNHSMATMRIFKNSGKDLSSCCRNPRHPISSNSPYTKTADMAITGMLPLINQAIAEINNIGTAQYKRNGASNVL